MMMYWLSVMAPALLVIAMAFDCIIAFLRKCWYWMHGGCVRRVARHSKLVIVGALPRNELCACEFLLPDGSVQRTLERGGVQPFTSGEVQLIDLHVRKTVAAFDVHPLPEHAPSDAELNRCRQFLYDHCSGFNREVEPSAYELVKLMEAAFKVPLLSRVDVVLDDMTELSFEGWDVVAF